MPKEKNIYLVAHYAKTPRDPGKSRHKGYMLDEKNVSYVENVTLTRGLKTRDLKAAIILNLTEKKVEKCRFGGQNDWESLTAYYAKGYPQYMKLIKPEEPEKEEAVVEEKPKKKAAKKKAPKKKAVKKKEAVNE